MHALASSIRSDDDLPLVESALHELQDYSNLAAAEALGISEATIRRWRSGSIAVPLRTATRLALRDFFRGRDGPARSGPPQVQAAKRMGSAPGAASVALFTSTSSVREYIAGIAPPGDSTARKMDVLHGMRQAITARTPVPDWWYDLYDEVRTGRL